MRDARRAQIVEAFARTLARHGYAGSTMILVAEEAGVSPGLLHHHFEDKDEMLDALLTALVAGFRARIRVAEAEDPPLLAYVHAALRLDERADVVAARCWASVFAEALRHPPLFRRVRALVDAELESIVARSSGRLDAHDAGAVLAYVVGALVLGAFAPKKTAGFAARGLVRLVSALEADRAGARA